MIEINAIMPRRNCALERGYVRRDFALDHCEELFLLVFIPSCSYVSLAYCCTAGRFYRIKNTTGRLRHRIPFCKHPSSSRSLTPSRMPVIVGIPHRHNLRQEGSTYCQCDIRVYTHAHMLTRAYFMVRCRVYVLQLDKVGHLRGKCPSLCGCVTRLLARVVSTAILRQ